MACVRVNICETFWDAHHTPLQVFAGYHYDLNFLTIHGKARFPGLHVWLRDGRRVPVKVPDGCLLLQVPPSVRPTVSNTPRIYKGRR